MNSAQALFPTYSRSERIADGCVHAASVMFAVAGAAVLLGTAAFRVPISSLTGLIVYCIGLLGMFGTSAAYNLASRRDLKEILRRVDHAAIFVMIAGSYTPFAILAGGAAGRAMLVAAWAIAFAGIAIKLGFPRRLDKLSILLYLTQGWIVILALDPIVAALPKQAFWLLLAGGAVYTLGVPIHLMERMRFHNAIWHVFVLGGAVCQFAAIKYAVIPA